MCFGTDDEEITSQQIDKDIKNWYKGYKYAIKILLLGAGEAGKTTVLKQMKILHVKGFSYDERVDRAEQIKKNIHEAASELTRQLKPLGLEPGEPAQKAASAIMEMGTAPPPFTQDYFDIITTFWADAAVKECLRRSNEYQLIDSAEYFLNKIDSVRQPNYLPDDKDILQCRQRTTGIQKIDFSVKIPKSMQYGMQGGMQEFWMFDVGGQRGERKKWIQVFEGIHAVWFLVASSDFDQTLREDTSHNRLRESITLFEDVWKSRFLVDAGLIVFLNKQDILERKVREGRDIAKYFPEYVNFKATEKNLPNDEFECTKLFIKNLLVQVTQNRNHPSRQDMGLQLESSRSRECYYHYTTATNTDNIRTVFNDVHDLILNKRLQEYIPV